MWYRTIFFAALLGVSLTAEVALAEEKAGEKKGLKVELMDQEMDAVTAAGPVNLPPQLSSLLNQLQAKVTPCPTCTFIPWLVNPVFPNTTVNWTEIKTLYASSLTIPPGLLAFQKKP